MSLRPESMIGQRVDRYVLEELLGKGGFGAVYRAAHLVTGRQVAIKMLHERRSVDPIVVRRFVREAQITTAIGHPGIVDVLDAGTAEDGTPFLVMELLSGVSLRHYLERSGPLETPDAVALTRQILDALAAAHRKGIVHRDIKPDNIFVTEADGEPTTKLLDFGVGKVVRSVDKLTDTGVTIGSPYYMPPEQFLGSSDSDQRSDLYSVAAVLYEMLSGTPPFGEETEIQKLIVRLSSQLPTPLSQRNPSVAGPLAQVVDRCLSRDPDGRFPSADSFAEALSAAVLGRRVAAAPSTMANAPTLAVSSLSFAPPEPKPESAALQSPVPQLPVPKPGPVEPRKEKSPLLAILVVGLGSAVLTTGGLLLALFLSGEMGGNDTPVEDRLMDSGSGARLSALDAGGPVDASGDQSRVVDAYPDIEQKDRAEATTEVELAPPPIPRLRFGVQGNPAFDGDFRAMARRLMPQMNQCTRSYRGSFTVRIHTAGSRIFSSSASPQEQAPRCVAGVLFRGLRVPESMGNGSQTYVYTFRR